MFIATSMLFMPKFPPLILKWKTSRPFEPLMSWKDASEKLNWSVVFLIAGGFALADCVHVSLCLSWFILCVFFKCHVLQQVAVCFTSLNRELSALY